MKHSFKIALMGTAAAFSLSAIAMANPKADTNQDGQISKAEFVDAANAKFARTDANGDGLLTEAERQADREAMRAQRQAERFSKADKNGDGFISQDEFNSGASERDARRKERMDANGDGTVDKADREARRAKMKEKREERKSKRKERKKDQAKKKRIKIDANDDGFISLAEHATATDAMFERLDANGDGVLSKGEGRKRKRKGKRRAER
jgi:hypothetical protein